MFVNNFSWPNLHFNPNLFLRLPREEKINTIIASIACGILLAGCAYYICSNFWSSRSITPQEDFESSPPPYKFPKKPSSDPHANKKHSQKKSGPNAKNDNVVNNGQQSQKPVNLSQKKNDKGVFKDIFEEKSLSSGKIELLSPLSQPATKVNIRMTSSEEAGCVGDEPELIPHLSQFKSIHQTPLDLDRYDVIISLDCFDLPAGLSLPSPIYLPVSLFEDFSMGNSVRLYYEDQLLELCIHQTEDELMSNESSFEDALMSAKLTSLEKTDPLFGRFIHYSWYKLDGGTVYRVVDDHNRLAVKAVSTDKFRPLLHTCKTSEMDEYWKNERGTDGTIITDLLMDIHEEESEVVFTGDLAIFTHDHIDCIDLILNDKTLAIHIMPLPMTLTTEKRKKAKADGLNSIPQEFVTGFKWKNIFPSTPLVEMQERMERATIILKDGTIQLVVPRHL